MKPTTSNLACVWGLPRPIMNPTRRKSGCGPRLDELPEIWGFLFNISATAELRDFKFGTQLGFAKDHHTNHTQTKSGGGLGLEELPKILGSSIIFLQLLGQRLQI